jgi:hypothetical protein
VTTSPRSSRRSRASVAAAAFLFVAVLALVAGGSSPAGAGDGGDAGQGNDPTTSLVLGDPDEGIIPRPNSGHEPTEAGDRGGALQFAVLGLIVVGVGFVGVKVFRQVNT